ncbi:hypothetical protein M011DRAFT_405197 [Sporormia fimetaria CBS 119925]|uniref:Uncharacterized protein n=1 Tax=Sporormia fimetaria CBS 119925 TaxID=1340428 RepID=A0A6A6V8W9_9PLEO|nr:hypothetical protein M011DRAFT_405197 [Sporormia fimetaria CBS 119925]
MGGLAFVDAGISGASLNVPRLPPDVYKEMIAQLRPKLQQLFNNVVIPREGPGKTDHGDIDFLVEGALCTSDSSAFQTLIGEAIGATHFRENGGTKTYAVPHVRDPEKHVQVDVEICPGEGTPEGPELLKWTLFMKSDSDLVQIIGICHTPLGITCNDKGMHVRVKEIEPYDRKKSLLFLTRNPHQALQFFGLDAPKYFAGFESEEDLFRWVSQGRFFSKREFENRRENGNDRARQRKRGMYRGFIEEFVPSLEEPSTPGRIWTREQVLQEALSTFDKQNEYQSMVRWHEIRERDIAIWARVREILPASNSLNATLRSLRRWVIFSDGKPSIAPDAMLDNHPVWGEVVVDEDDVLSWVWQNWQEVKALEKARVVGLLWLKFVRLRLLICLTEP